MNAQGPQCCVGVVVCVEGETILGRGGGVGDSVSKTLEK